MTLFRNFAILRLMCGFPFAPIQILTGDTREGCNSRHSRLHDERRSFQRKSRIERRFESLPGVQRVATLWGTFGSFRTSEKNKIVPFAGSFEVLQTSNQRTKPKFRTNKIKSFSKGDSRFCKPRISPPQQQLRTNPIKSFRCLLAALSLLLSQQILCASRY